MTDEERANQVYLAAKTTAMAEFDAMEELLNTLNRRANALRAVIRLTSELTGTELDEKYEFRRLEPRKKEGHAPKKDWRQTNFPVANTGRTAGE